MRLLRSQASKSVSGITWSASLIFPPWWDVCSSLCADTKRFTGIIFTATQWRQTLLLTWLWGVWDTKKWRHLPDVSQVRGGTRIQTLDCLTLQANNEPLCWRTWFATPPRDSTPALGWGQAGHPLWRLWSSHVTLSLYHHLFTRPLT